MKKLRHLLYFSLVFFCYASFNVSSTQAANSYMCKSGATFETDSPMPLSLDGGSYQFTFNVDTSGSWKYRMHYKLSILYYYSDPESGVMGQNSKVTLSLKMPPHLPSLMGTVIKIPFVLEYYTNGKWKRYSPYENCTMQIDTKGAVITQGYENCILTPLYDEKTRNVSIMGVGVPNIPIHKDHSLAVNKNASLFNPPIKITSITNGQFTQNIGSYAKGDRLVIDLVVHAPPQSSTLYTGCQVIYVVGENFFNGLRNVEKCTVDGDLEGGLETALGCIPTKPNALISWLLATGISLGGGIAFLLMIFGAFQVILSGGDPEKLNAGKEVLTSAVAGLLMIIFSVVLLKIIGYDILRIPGITLK